MKRTRFEVPCQPGELEAWRLAAGDVPLARWCRRVLNAAARAEAMLIDGGRVDVGGDVRVEIGPDDRVKLSAAPRAFTPDFGKRLKP